MSATAPTDTIYYLEKVPYDRLETAPSCIIGGLWIIVFGVWMFTCALPLGVVLTTGGIGVGMMGYGVWKLLFNNKSTGK
jgi:hypothetical protein